jgi:hypothetical protein
MMGSYMGEWNYPFNIWALKRREADVDPRDFPPDPKSKCTPERFENGIDPSDYFEKMDLMTLIYIWAKRYQIYNRSKHPLIEIFYHLIFPRSEERLLVYIALWRFRDKCSLREIGRRLGARRGKPLHTSQVGKYVKYIERRAARFCRRVRFTEKFAAQLQEELETEQEQTWSEEDIREIVGGK